MKLTGFIVGTILTTLCVPAAVQAYFTGVHVEISVSADSVSVGDSVTIVMTVGAYTTSSVQTNAVVTLSLPPGTTNAVSSGCTLTDPLTMVCAMPELAPDEDTELSVLATLNLEGNNLFTASVNTDKLVYDARFDSKIVAVEKLPADESPVDLQVEVIRTSDDNSILKSHHFEVTVANNHQSNSATFPIVKIVLEDTYQFFSADNCTAAGQLVTCDFSRLPPGSESAIEIVLNPAQLDDSASITASVNSTQPDTAPQNNDAQYIGNIVAGEILCGGGCQPEVIDYVQGNSNSDNEQSQTDSANIEAAATDSATTAADSSSGGGAVTAELFLLLLLGWLAPAGVCTLFSRPFPSGQCR